MKQMIIAILYQALAIFFGIMACYGVMEWHEKHKKKKEVKEVKSKYTKHT